LAYFETLAPLTRAAALRQMPATAALLRIVQAVAAR
jgi:hypothetical protein